MTDSFRQSAGQIALVERMSDAHHFDVCGEDVVVGYSVQRKDAADSDNNAGDFAAGAPTPGATNVGGGGDTGEGDPGPLRIHDIQDSSWLAAHNGEQVTNVPGIVTGIRTTGSSRG